MNKEEAIRKMEIEKLTINPIGYESPVQVFSNYVEDLVTQKENYIAMQVSEQMHVQVDREELVKALAYERDQWAVILNLKRSSRHLVSKNIWGR